MLTFVFLFLYLQIISYIINNYIDFLYLQEIIMLIFFQNFNVKFTPTILLFLIVAIFHVKFLYFNFKI